jgi:DNA topoisomerase-1
MEKKVIIVESPAKTKTLKSFLKDGFKITASMGHIRDLPQRALGVDIDDGFTPKFIIIPKKKAVVEKLKEETKDADVVYLASDPDREGEAIAWHLAHVLKLKNPLRIEFNEITRDAVLEGLKHPRPIDMNRVYSQHARRILDRIVGYKLSPLLWDKLGFKTLSAGRVQSVALRLICEREREIQAFVPEEYWTITARLTSQREYFPFDAILITRNGEKISIKNEEEANKILQELEGAEYRVKSIKKQERKRNPPPPFITSTLQQEASNRLGFTPARTMRIAQQLYEGIEIDEGTVGLITYMRTDSVRIAESALAEAREFLKQNFGEEFLPPTPRRFKVKESAQDAHEAIRPTSVFRTPEKLARYLNSDQLKLYTLIWRRFLASQMKEAIVDHTTVDISAKDFIFRATGSVVKFPGFLIIYEDKKEEIALPELFEGEILDLIELIPAQHFTQPPPRYNDASLVKALEQKGIGRPSTYAVIIQTLLDRNYVVRENRQLIPTEMGFKVNDLLVEHFPDIVDVSFTAKMEEELDDIERGLLRWDFVLEKFYDSFSKTLKQAFKVIEKEEKKEEKLEEKCPLCGAPLVLKYGRYGQFISCSNFPQCRYKRSITSSLGIKCPMEGCDGEIVERRTKKGKLFYGCSNYPKCKFASWLKPTNHTCPKCSFILGEKMAKGEVVRLVCLREGCDYQEEVGEKEEIKASE